MSCNVTHNKELVGPEYAQAYTIPYFERKLPVCWNKIPWVMRTVSTKSLTLSAAVYKCVTTKWNPCATSSIKVSGQRRVHEMHEGHLWTVVIGTNLSDQGIHWLCPKSKTGDMQFEESKS
jgi:hypothetical protein